MTVMGLGTHGGGVGIVRYLALQGAEITVTDVADEAALQPSLQALANVPVKRFRLGRHDVDDFTSAETIIVNPAVLPSAPLIELAREHGAKITSETELFLNLCPAPVIGVTGSNGKSTTASMIHAMVSRSGRTSWLGGNIGRSLLPVLGSIEPQHIVVLELSSFQLHWLSDHARMPDVCAITSLQPNHLDWHGDLAEYDAAKQRILGPAGAQSAVVLNPADPALNAWYVRLQPRVLQLFPLEKIPPLQVLGTHNRINASLAATAALHVGCNDRAILDSLREFNGLKHRIEFVAEAETRCFYNDSKATTPDAAIAAIRAIDRPIWLLAGGYNKGLDFGLLAQTISERCTGLAVFGKTGDELAAATRRYGPHIEIVQAVTLDDAFHRACEESRAGDAILLSPACASYDQFRDYADRGEHFIHLVNALRNKSLLFGPTGQERREV